MIQYREAIQQDLPSICALGNEVNAIHHDAFPQVFAQVGAHNRDAAHWTNHIAQESATTFVAEHNGLLIGFVSIRVVSETHSMMQAMRYGSIGSVCVTQNNRGQGIGRALMQYAQDWVIERGGQEIRLHVWAFNSRSVQLYKELGYEIRTHAMTKPLIQTNAK